VGEEREEMGKASVGAEGAVGGVVDGGGTRGSSPVCQARLVTSVSDGEKDATVRELTDDGWDARSTFSPRVICTVELGLITRMGKVIASAGGEGEQAFETARRTLAPSLVCDVRSLGVVSPSSTPIEGGGRGRDA
jgi:hypothetical protein